MGETHAEGDSDLLHQLVTHPSPVIFIYHYFEKISTLHKSE